MDTKDIRDAVKRKYPQAYVEIHIAGCCWIYVIYQKVKFLFFFKRKIRIASSIISSHQAWVNALLYK